MTQKPEPDPDPPELPEEKPPGEEIAAHTTGGKTGITGHETDDDPDADNPDSEPSEPA